MLNGSGRRSGRRQWQNSATAAAQGTLTERWRRTTEQWLGARAQYQALSKSTTADVVALCDAAQRWHDLAMRRLALAQSLEVEAK
jgi:hypothetical protein